MGQGGHYNFCLHFLMFMIFLMFMLKFFGKVVVFLFWLWTDMSSQNIATSLFKTGAFFEGMVASLQAMAHCNKKAKPELARTEQSQEQEQ